MQQELNKCEKHATFISESGSARLHFFDDNKEYLCTEFIGEGYVFDILLADHPFYDSVLSIFVKNINDIDSLRAKYPECFI